MPVGGVRIQRLAAMHRTSRRGQRRAGDGEQVHPEAVRISRPCNQSPGVTTSVSRSPPAVVAAGSVIWSCVERSRSIMKTPGWWHWDLELGRHLLERMRDRGFSEVDLRPMIERATAVHRSAEWARWIVETRHDGRPWQVVVEPDFALRLLIVITAYPVESS